jgi:hypothetical protein
MNTPLLNKKDIIALLNLCLSKVPAPVRKLLECCILYIEEQPVNRMGHTQNCEWVTQVTADPWKDRVCGPHYCGWCGGYIGK